MLMPASFSPSSQAVRSSLTANIRVREFMGGSAGVRSALRIGAAVLLALLVTAIPILVSGRSPIAAYSSLANGAFGSHSP
jgi:hypothetical protein